MHKKTNLHIPFVQYSVLYCFIQHRPNNICSFVFVYIFWYHQFHVCFKTCWKLCTRSKMYVVFSSLSKRRTRYNEKMVTVWYAMRTKRNTNSKPNKMKMQKYLIEHKNNTKKRTNRNYWTNKKWSVGTSFLRNCFNRNIIQET